MGQEIQQGQGQGVAVAGWPGGSIPPGLLPVLRSSWNVATASEEWQRPRSVTGAEKGAARQLLVEARSRYWPAPTARLQNRLQAFLGHWYVADDAAMAGRFVDWMRSFEEFPLWVVDAACCDYLRVTDKKPSIAALRVLCQQRDELGRLIARLRVLVEQVPVVEAPTPPDPVARERVGAWLAVARRQAMTLSPEQHAAFDRGEMPPVEASAQAVAS